MRTPDDHPGCTAVGDDGSQLSRDNRLRGRWTGDRATIPEWFRTYFDLERDAEDLRTYQVEIVPGLFQTEAYMRAVYSHRIARSNDGLDVDAAVRSRLERQEVLDQVDPPTVSCVLSEWCVRRMVGGREVMAAQLRRLADLTDRPRVRIQLLPFDSEGVGGMGLRFTLLRIPAARAAQPFTFAYCEDLEDSRYVDDEAAVRIYESAWAGLSAPMQDADRLPVHRWRTSSFSDNNGGDCVEVAFDGDAVLVRDTKQQGRGPVLAFTRRGWAAFLVGTRAGEFDLT